MQKIDNQTSQTQFDRSHAFTFLCAHNTQWRTARLKYPCLKKVDKLSSPHTVHIAVPTSITPSACPARTRPKFLNILVSSNSAHGYVCATKRGTVRPDKRGLSARAYAFNIEVRVAIKQFCLQAVNNKHHFFKTCGRIIISIPPTIKTAKNASNAGAKLAQTGRWRAFFNC